MNGPELLRLIEYVERVHQPYHALFPLAAPDPVWNIVVHLIRSHVRQEAVTVSELARVAEVPYATAMRRIGEMVSAGLIRRSPRGRSGRSFALHPSETMMADFLSYARHVKSLLAQTMGVRPTPESEEDYHFGGALLDAQLAPPPALLRARLQPQTRLRFLMHSDNYCDSLRDLWADFRNNLGSRRDFDLRPLPALYERVRENAALEQSAYDVIALNSPWLGEAVERGWTRRAEDFIYRAGIDSLDFDPAVWATGRWRGRQEAVPIFSSVELMVVRGDMFAQAGFPMPRTFAEVLATGRHFHAPRRGRYGITWSGQRGMPLASSFAFVLGCCGGSVLQLPRNGTVWTPDGLDAAPVPVTLDTDAARAALDYMHGLVDISQPGVLDMDWNTALELFMSGQAAMTYCWSMRAARLQSDPASKVRGRIRYLPQPAGPGGSHVSPLGGFLLAVPANLAEARIGAAFEAIRWMTSPEAMRTHVRTGFPVLPRFSMSGDPDMKAASPMVSVVNDLGRRGLLQTWQRPPIPQYRRIEAVLGNQIHAALTRQLSDSSALREAQRQIERILAA